MVGKVVGGGADIHVLILASFSLGISYRPRMKKSSMTFDPIPTRESTIIASLALPCKFQPSSLLLMLHVPQPILRLTRSITYSTSFLLSHEHLYSSGYSVFITKQLANHLTRQNRQRARHRPGSDPPHLARQTQHRHARRIRQKQSELGVYVLPFFFSWCFNLLKILPSTVMSRTDPFHRPLYLTFPEPMYMLLASLPHPQLITLPSLSASHNLLILT